MCTAPAFRKAKGVVFIAPCRFTFVFADGPPNRGISRFPSLVVANKDSVVVVFRLVQHHVLNAVANDLLVDSTST